MTSRLNNALRRLGSGWAVFIEAQRVAAQTYSAQHVSRMRRRRWSISNARDAFEGGRHAFESRYFLTFAWLPPAEDASRVEGWLYEGPCADRRRSVGAGAQLRRSH